MRSKVLHVIDSLNVGGAEKVLVALCNILKLQQVDVSVCILTERLGLLHFLDEQIPIHRLKRTFKWSLFKLYEVNRLCSGFDIVHVHMRYNLRYIGLAKLLFGGNYRIVLHDHFGDIEKDKTVPFGLSFFMTRAWYIGVHSALVNWAIDHANVKRERAFFLANTIQKNRAAALPNMADVSEQSHLPIIQVANFRVSKNQLFAVQLVEQLSKQYTVKMVLTGGINEPDYYAKIQQLVGALGLNNQVGFVHDLKDVQPELHKYTLAIHTASMESGPLVLLEYLAVGLPFLAYKTGQVAEELQPDFPEFFLETFKIQDWIDRIQLILKMNLPALQQRMIKHFERQYAPEVYGERCQALYRQIMES